MVIIMTCIFWGTTKEGLLVCSETNGTNNKVAFDVDKLGYMEAKMGQSHLLRWRGSERERERNKNGMEWGYSYIICKKIAIWQGFLTKTSSTYGYSSQLGIGKLKELRRLDCTTTQCRGKSIWARAIWVFRVPKCVGQKRRWNTGFPEHRLPQIIILFLFIFLGDIYRS